MRQTLYSCALIDGSGSVLRITRIAADDPVDAGRHAELLASTYDGDICFQLRRIEQHTDCGALDS